MQTRHAVFNGNQCISAPFTDVKPYRLPQQKFTLSVLVIALVFVLVWAFLFDSWMRSRDRGREVYPS